MTRNADWASRHPDDFAAFYASTATYVQGMARRTAAGDDDRAWNATQDAYVKMRDKWSDRRWRSVRDNRSYVTRIAVNNVIDSYRVDRRRPRSVQLNEEHDRAFEDDAFDAVLNESLYAVVLEFLDRQPVQRRAVGVLYLFEELSTAEVSKTLRITESTVRTHVQRLRAQLKPYVAGIIEEQRGGERS